MTKNPCRKCGVYVQKCKLQRIYDHRMCNGKKIYGLHPAMADLTEQFCEHCFPSRDYADSQADFYIRTQPDPYDHTFPAISTTDKLTEKDLSNGITASHWVT